MMANMAYCRFHNTASDLRDVEENWHEKDLSELSKGELQGKLSIIRSSVRILALEGVDINDDDDFAAAVDEIKSAIAAAEGK